MSPVPPLLPLEFTVEGPPVSARSENRPLLDGWRQRVRAAAAARWGSAAPVAVPLGITVVYYHLVGTSRIDLDNLLKPVQDALTGLVYVDDVWITDVALRKTRAAAPIVVPGLSGVLLEAFAAGREFVHVKVDRAPAHTTPLG